MAKQKTYTVKSLSLGGLNGKIFDSGDVVTQDQLAAPVEDLIKSGFLVDEKAKESKDDKSDDAILAQLEAEEAAKKADDEDAKKKK